MPKKSGFKKSAFIWTDLTAQGKCLPSHKGLISSEDKNSVFRSQKNNPAMSATEPFWVNTLIHPSELTCELIHVAR